MNELLLQALLWEEQSSRVGGRDGRKRRAQGEATRVTLEASLLSVLKLLGQNMLTQCKAGVDGKIMSFTWATI